MNIGTIQGGTNAGWRKVKAANTAWSCTCGNHNRAYLVRCYACNGPRAEGFSR